MAHLLRQKGTGDLFMYTTALAALPDMEEVVEDPVAKIIAEVKAQDADLEAALSGSLPEVVAEPLSTAPVAEDTTLRLRKSK
jgi:hypothetical protein